MLDGRRATKAYAEWMFAFGFARLGDGSAAKQCSVDAARHWDQLELNREFHRLARQAFEYRVGEAKRGEPHTGTLDDRCPEVMAAVFPPADTPGNSEPGNAAYQLGRLLWLSSILEPDRILDPYRRFVNEHRQESVSVWGLRPVRSDEWNHQLGTDDSPQAIWQALRPTEAEAVKQAGARWRDEVSRTSVVRLPALLVTLRSFPLATVERVLTAIVAELPPTTNSFCTAPVFSRLHLVFVDPLVLAVAGTGPLIVGEEVPARLELLHHLRRPVLSWIDAMP